MHSYFIIPGIIDGAVVHKQADERRKDRRSPEDSIVHAHSKGETCNTNCKYYKVEMENIHG